MSDKVKCRLMIAGAALCAALFLFSGAMLALSLIHISSVSWFGGYFDITALKGQNFPCQVKSQAKPLRRVR